MPWILLSAASPLEMAGITSMKPSRGFAERIPSAAVPVFYVLSAAAVILALKRLDRSVTYAVWWGSALLSLPRSAGLFQRAAPLVQIASLLLVFGVIGLSSRQADTLTAAPLPANIAPWTV